MGGGVCRNLVCLGNAARDEGGQVTPFTAIPIKAAVMESELEPWSFEEGQVLDGEPRSSGLILWKSADGKLCNGIWQCTPGRFTWEHVDETVCVVAGSATVTPAGGEPLQLRPGDVAFFPAGLKTEWHVHETTRKVFHLHSTSGLGL